MVNPKIKALLNFLRSGGSTANYISFEIGFTQNFKSDQEKAVAINRIRPKWSCHFAQMFAP
jgi:hypothetical protein